MLYLKCEGQVMRVDVDERIADKYINANTVHFEFCDRWDGMVITAQFTQNGKTYDKVVDAVTNTVLLPNEIAAGTVEISAFGEHPTTGVRITSIAVKKTVDKSGFVGDGETSIPPTPDLYAQLLDKINKTAIPHIGANGNWWFDDWDSGVAATAEIETAKQAAVNEINKIGANQQVAIENKAENALASIPDDYVTLGNNVSRLKDHIIDESILRTWEHGSFNYPDGAYYVSTTRIRLTEYVGVYNRVFNATASEDYDIAVFAWGEDGAYIGAMMTSGSIAKSGTLAWVDHFDFSKYPDYRFKIALRKTSGEPMNPEYDAENCIFETTAFMSREEAEAEVEKSWQNKTVDDYSGWVGNTRAIRLANGVLENQPEFASYRVTNFIPVRGYAQIIVTMPRTNMTYPPDTGLCFYDKNQVHIPFYGGASLYRRGDSTYKDKNYDKYAEDIAFTIPENAAYIRTTFWTESYIATNCPDVKFRYTLIAKGCEPKGITHEPPINSGMLNAIRRARQLTDIKWTPAFDVPRYCLADGDFSGESNVHFDDVCKAEVEYTGIPYSGANTNQDYGVIAHGYQYLSVGNHVDFETFVTAARYPKSVMGLESADGYFASAYGSVCTALCSYATGIMYRVQVANFYKANGMSLIGLLSGDEPLDPSAIMLGDILWSEPHVAMVTDILRDIDGKATAFEVSEATTVGNANNGSVKGGQLGGMCRRKCWSIEDFYGWFRRYSVYRWRGYTNVSYEPSPYVDTGDELKRMPIVDLPCIPYMGNKFVYIAGRIENTNILIGAKGFTHLRVTKDGENYNANGTGGLYSVSGDTVDVGFSEPGSYRAYLCNSTETNRSRACEWTVSDVMPHTWN